MNDGAAPASLAPARVLFHGTVVRRGSFWIIGCGPQTMIRLKRVLGKVDKASKDEVRLRVSDEADRELQWFLDRFPMEMSDQDAALLHRGAEKHRATSRTIAALTSGAYVPRAFDLAIPPRDYQRLAADWWLQTNNLLLADDTGLGKTLTAIAGMSDPSARPALVVTPAGAVPLQWRDMIAAALPAARVHVVKGTTPYDIEAASAKEQRKLGRVACGYPDIVICPYARLSGWSDTLRQRVVSVVYDEGQELRHRKHGNTVSLRWAAAYNVSTTPTVTRRLALSATPTVNYGAEFWNVMECVAPGALGDRAEFDREWTIPGEEERKRKIRDPRAFGLYLRESGLMLRRTRKEAGRELPQLTTVPFHIEADLDALRQVSASVAELARTILAQTIGKGSGLSKMQAGSTLDRLIRQATGIAKAPFLATFIRGLVESGERVLVGLWHREVYNILGDKLRDLAPAFYTGEESEKQKAESLRRFKAGETPILCMSLRSGAALDGLQYACRTVVIGELDWSHVIHHQLISRVDRDGQPDKVVAYFPIADAGSDPVVSEICGAKRANSEPIRNPDKVVAEAHVDPDHIRRLAESILAGKGHR